MTFGQVFDGCARDDAYLTAARGTPAVRRESDDERYGANLISSRAAYTVNVTRVAR